MAKTRASVRFFRDTALGATCLFAACSSGSGAPAGGGNSTGGTPPPPTGFALFTSNRTRPAELQLPEFSPRQVLRFGSRLRYTVHTRT